MGSAIGSILGLKKPKIDESKYNDPYDNELRARLYGIVDHYMKQRGMSSDIPAENRPYELRSEEERAQIREDKGDNKEYFPTVALGYQKPREDENLLPKPPKAKNIDLPRAEMNDDEESTKEEEPTKDKDTEYKKAAFLAGLEAQKFGIDPRTILSGNRGETAQPEYDALIDFIKGRRKFSRSNLNG